MLCPASLKVTGDGYVSFLRLAAYDTIWAHFMVASPLWVRMVYMHSSASERARQFKFGYESFCVATRYSRILHSENSERNDCLFTQI